MSNWAVFFLGIIALSTLSTALAQIGLMLYAGRLVRRLARVIDDIERELEPLLASASAMGHDAARAASLAVAQLERADRLFGDVAARIEETLAVVQHAIITPARQGAAIVAGLRAAFSAFRRSSQATERTRAEEEEALFI